MVVDLKSGTKQNYICNCCVFKGHSYFLNNCFYCHKKMYSAQGVYDNFIDFIFTLYILRNSLMLSYVRKAQQTHFYLVISTDLKHHNAPGYKTEFVTVHPLLTETFDIVKPLSKILAYSKNNNTHTSQNNIDLIYVSMDVHTIFLFSMKFLSGKKCSQ